MKKTNFIKTVFLLLGIGFLNTWFANAQLQELICYPFADGPILNGTAEDKDQHNGAQSNGTMYNNPYTEGWYLWELDSLTDTLSGNSIFYAEVAFQITNTTPPKQGFRALHVKEDPAQSLSDKGGEGNLWTWNRFTTLFSDFETGSNQDTLHVESLTPSKAGGRRIFEVTNSIKYELGTPSKQFALRCVPYHTSYDGTEEDERWLSFYQRESQWDGYKKDPFYPGDSVSLFAPELRLYYGTFDTIFNDTIESFGNILNYNRFPSNPYTNWLVEEGILKMKNDAPTPFGKGQGKDGLGAYAVFKKNIYSEFEFTFTGKIAKEDNIIAKNDLAIVFNYQNDSTYYYFLVLNHKDRHGFYKVEGSNGSLIATKIGDGTQFESKDTLFHTYRVVRTAEKMEIYQDNNLIGTTTDSDILSGSGKIGVGSSGTIVSFDNLYVEGEGQQVESVKPIFSNNVKLYPNPVNSELNISLQNNISSIAVYNVLGSMVMEEQGLNNSTAQLNVSELKTGIYFIHVKNTENNSVAVSKFLKVD